MKTDKPVVVVGGGLVGCLLACYLSRRGYSVELYERRSDPRKGSTERGRSINLALSARGIDALQRIGLEATVMAPALPMYGRQMHNLDGSEVFQSYSHHGDLAINSISRGALNETLLTVAENATNVTLHFDTPLLDYDVSTNTLSFETADGVKKVEAHAVLGADGGGSVVRQSLARAGHVQVSEDKLDYGYKELTIPANGEDFAMRPDALHIWPRGESMLIALPNPDKSFTCTLFWPKVEFDSMKTDNDIVSHFADVYPDAITLIPDLVDDFKNNPVGMLGTIHTTPWHVNGSCALIGDAAHAILPFFGQGANAGFEDVVALDECLDETGDDWSLALKLYNERRFDNAEAIALMASENFVEMRDKVGSKMFLVIKKIEHSLARLFPGAYKSRYAMVSFSTIPYAEVLERSRRQSRALAVGSAAIAVGVAALAAVGLAGLRRGKR